MTREEAIKALNTLVKNDNLRRHHLAAGACMKALALHFKNQGHGLLNFGGSKPKENIDENEWETVGLLHDADYERTKDRPEEHGKIVIDEIRSLGFELSPDIAEAIKFHNKDYTKASESLMGWAIYTCDELTGLIVACALVRPDKKLASVTADFVSQKMKEPSFAKGALRDRILLCDEKLGIKLDEFLKICLKAMQEIASGIGL